MSPCLFLTSVTILIFLSYIYIYIYIYIEREREREIEKTTNPKFNEFIMKVDVERFRCNNLLQDFRFMKKVIKTAMDVWWNNRRKESEYKDERFITVYSVFLFLKILLRCCHVNWCYKFVGFLRDVTEDDKNNDRLYFLRNGRKECNITDGRRH